MLKMQNKDFEIQEEIELQTELKTAIESGDSDEFAAVQIKLAKKIEARVLEAAKAATKEAADGNNDQAILTSRGLNALTTEELKFYNEVIGGEGFTGTQKLVPATVFDRVFEELRTKHPLLSEISFQNTSGVIEWLVRNGNVEAAWWGELTDAITKKLSMAFRKEQTGLYKLSCWIPVAKAMLDLGPQWLDRFVREILLESMAMALELAIVAGTGKNQPIGMIKNLQGAVIDGVYPNKTATALNNLDPVSLGVQIMAPLTKEGTRAVPSVLLMVNPLDYWGKIFPNTTVMSAAGTYVHGVLPIPAKVVQSVAVPQNRLIAGMGKDYFMGVGSTQRLEHSDHYKFLEDERTYIAKQYANGKPIYNESFLIFDIAGMTAPQV